ncbi:hypothetical protein M422DRAFT_55766 [Sphaerobolus stellatus SS14]|uniref:Uncharacterized protein n=1 Tax=Sphaerobolus stellatus (strain SS14) TaxID=990650 RepID=A0A0C9TVL8_SPHS4|nr:hypothetical protein M422DRAFT_55766 [Sphaerobolus stellatus SS14]
MAGPFNATENPSSTPSPRSPRGISFLLRSTNRSACDHASPYDKHSRYRDGGNASSPFQPRISEPTYGLTIYAPGGANRDRPKLPSIKFIAQSVNLLQPTVMRPAVYCHSNNPDWVASRPRLTKAFLQQVLYVVHGEEFHDPPAVKSYPVTGARCPYVDPRTRGRCEFVHVKKGRKTSRTVYTVPAPPACGDWTQLKHHVNHGLDKMKAQLTGQMGLFQCSIIADARSFMTWGIALFVPSLLGVHKGVEELDHHMY